MCRFASVAAALIAAIVIVCWTTAGMAHAVLVASEPQEGAVLDVAPSEIALRFNEPVVPVSLRMLDAAGRSVVLPRPDEAADSALRIVLPDDLPSGGYLVSWRVVSADAHPIGGSFVFSIGNAEPSAVADDQLSRESRWKVAVIANRAIGDVALLLAAGGVLALGLVFREAAPGIAIVWLTVAATVAVVSAGLSIPFARGWIAAAPAGALLDPASWAVGADAPHHARLALIVVGLAGMTAGLWRRMRSGRIIAALGALIACAGLPLSGHVAALEPALPGQIALFLHAAGAAFWVGALPLLAMALRRSAAADAYRVLRRFSAFAVPIVALLVLAGIGVALTRLRSVDALVASDYGRILLAKMALVALMLVLAVANRRLAGALPAASGPVAARIKRNVALEIGCAGAVLVLTAWLGHTRPPSDDAVFHDHAGRAFVAVEADGSSLLLEALPGRRGANRLTGRMVAADGRPLAARELTIELSLPEAGIEPLRARIEPENGAFSVEAITLPLAGRWQMRVDARIGDFEKRVFTLRLDIE